MFNLCPFDTCFDAGSCVYMADDGDCEDYSCAPGNSDAWCFHQIAKGQLNPISTAPKDGTYILLFGPSGYTTTPLRCEVGHWDAEYRPLDPWQTHSNDAFSDGGDPPTHWLPLPEVTL